MLQLTIFMRLQYHARNIQRIEGGLRQPGVLLALRMVVAVDADPGDFLKYFLKKPSARCARGRQHRHPKG